MCEGLVGGSSVHGLLQALLVDWHLDRNVRQAVVKLGVGLGCDGRVVARVLVELGDGTDAADNVSAGLHGNNEVRLTGKI